MPACVVCGAPVTAVRSTKRTCGDRCRQKLSRDRRPGRHSKRHSKRLNAIVPRGTNAERGHDCYQTPPEAILPLLGAEEVPAVVWEPACGPGALARVLRASGRHVIATDLIDYDSPDQDGVLDFLTATAAPPGIECIVTNPPYRRAAEFAAHAIRLCPRVIMLLRLSFLEGKGPRRTGVLESGQLARVHVFRDRLPMMHREGWQGRRIKQGALAFGWFVWDRAHTGAPTVARISCG